MPTTSCCSRQPAVQPEVTTPLSDASALLVTPTASDLTNINRELFVVPTQSALQNRAASTHAPRILLLYGSLRERSFSRLLSEEAARLLQAMGAETCTFNPHGLPLVDATPDTHEKVQQLRQLAL